MANLENSKNQLPKEVYTAISGLMKFLENVEDKYIESNTTKEDENENS